MPIVVAADTTAPLRQGDVLRFSGALYVTDYDGNPEAAAKQTEHVLVISRNCKAIRAKHVLVCPIHPTRQLLDGSLGSTYKEVSDQLDSFRDGGRSPDRFYLGNLDETGMRHAAHLDEMYLIEVPEQETARRDYVRAHRLWSLERDFLHDLHARIFNCFARQGFDDDSWFSDSDLDLLITRASADEARAQLDLVDKQTKLNLELSSKIDGKKKQGLEKAIRNAEVAAEEASAQLRKLQAERDRRRRSDSA